MPAAASPAGRHAVCSPRAIHQPGVHRMSLSRRALLGASGLAALPGLVERVEALIERTETTMRRGVRIDPESIEASGAPYAAGERFVDTW